MNAPRYAVYMMLDEPHATKATYGYATAGWVVAPAAGKVIARIGPMLGMLPDIVDMPQINQALAIPLEPGRPPGASRAVRRWSPRRRMAAAEAAGGPNRPNLTVPATMLPPAISRPAPDIRRQTEFACTAPMRTGAGCFDGRLRCGSLRSCARFRHHRRFARAWDAVAHLDIAGVTADSRHVVPGDLFAALPGSQVDGRAFIADAVERGAVAVLAPPGTAWPPGVPPRPMIIDPEPRQCLARIAAVLAGPQPETVVAVTGTNGKTSTVEFTRQLWASAGAKAASLGTLGLIAPGFDPGPGLTTPDPVSLAETLAGLARHGVTKAAMEASSHGLDQFRLDGVRLAAAAFTNLTRDHLDYHGTLEAYRQAKLRLFEALLPAGAPAVAHADMDAETLAALRDDRGAPAAGSADGGRAGRPVPAGRGSAAAGWAGSDGAGRMGVTRQVALNLPGPLPGG